MSPRRLTRKLAWSAAWLLAASGVFVAVAAWRSRAWARVSYIRTPTTFAYLVLTPLYVEIGSDAVVELDPLQVGSDKGRVWAVCFQDPQPTVNLYYDRKANLLWDRQWSSRGFRLALGQSAAGLFRYRLLDVPTWFAASTPLVPLVVLGGSRWLRRVRSPVGLCAKCGYDMRATPGRCPECGTAATNS